MENTKSILDLVGKTPLIEFSKMTASLPAQVLFKLEYFNPLQSVKDRIAKRMIENGEKQGKLKPGMVLIEPTSGNTGVGLAFVCAAKGYNLTLVMPETMSAERRTLLLMLGVKIVLTPGLLGMRGAVAKARSLIRQLEAQKKPCWMPSQFDNPSNPEVHFETTGPEIWTATEGKVDVVVSGVGTGGTLTGVGRYLKSMKSSVQMVAIEPEESPVISGGAPGPHKIQGIGAGFIPKNLDQAIISRIEKVSSQVSLERAREVIRVEGVPVGISSGATVEACIRVSKLPEFKGKLIVGILASATERYLSTLLAEEASKEGKSLPITEVTEAELNYP